MVFSAHQHQEKCQEQYKDLYSTFVNLTKAFDTVSCGGMWKVMAIFGCPSRSITIIREFHDGIMPRVLYDEKASQLFQISNGIRQC